MPRFVSAMMILDSQKHPIIRLHTQCQAGIDDRVSNSSVCRGKETLRHEKCSATRGCCELRANSPQAFLRLRSAQYFFIRSETALRADADIRDRRRRRRVVAGVSVAALTFARPRPPRNRSGNARRMAASSRRSSSSRARAPSRARRCNSCRVKRPLGQNGNLCIVN